MYVRSVKNQVIVLHKKEHCDVASLFPYLLRVGPDRRGKIADISLTAGAEFCNWVVKDLDPCSQAVPTVKKIRHNIVHSFSHDSGTTARLKTYNVYLDIGAQRARDQISRDRQGRPKNKRKDGIRRREFIPELCEVITASTVAENEQQKRSHHRIGPRISCEIDPG
ncbi:hypothetical protein TNCV_2388021 [Trichonephila clavipes]|nr:hypothetical protein TNCV_2388021 [Trichonephila clavipes]